jgi:hypothetical protein
MKEAPVLIWLSVLIVGGVGIWLATGGALPFSPYQPATLQPASDAQPDDAKADAAKQAEAAKQVKKRVAKAEKAKPAAPVVEAPPEPVVAAPVAVIAAPVPVPAPKQFPLANDISIGLERDNIAERFGEPSLATTTTSGDGRVMETLVYARRSGRDVTVIRVEDGKVLSVYSR